MSKKITPNSTLAEILKHKEAFEVLKKHNLPCLGCPMAQFEIEELKIKVCEAYKIDLNPLLEELNEKIKTKK